MKFSGHETFAIREGWLHKGLGLLIKDPESLFDECVADRLGVGKNMARSIRHWLEVTGLAVRTRSALAATDLGRLIYKRDPYFVEIGTWWALHVNLLHPENPAFTWQWFFNHFNYARFERAVCIENLSRYVKSARSRTPSPRTIDRDVACLLQSYARSIPTKCDDPEDALECPFVELGLLSHFHLSGDYQVHQGEKSIPAHLLGYALSKAHEEARTGRGTVDISVREAAMYPGGPGRAFALTAASLFTLALNAEKGDTDIRIVDLAGDRRIRIPRMQPIHWLKNHYHAIQRRNRHAA